MHIDCHRADDCVPDLILASSVGVWWFSSVFVFVFVFVIVNMCGAHDFILASSVEF